MFELIQAMREFTGMTVITVVFLATAAILVGSNRTVSRLARNAFLAVIIELICIALADWFVYVTNGSYPELRGVHIALVAATFIIVPTIPITIAQTIFPDRSVKWMMVLIGIHTVLQIANIFGGFIYWVDESNMYYRGPLYSVYMAVYSITALYLVVESIRAGRVYQSVNPVALVAIFICMMTGVAIQIVDYTVRMTWPAVSVAVVLYFLFYADMVTRTDALTKLLNRRSYEEALAKPPLPCVVVAIDVNDFKSVNDTHGHAFGDECLERIAQMIRHVFGGAGLCYRTGGDEFVVIMTKRLAEVDALTAEMQNASLAEQQRDSRMPGVAVGYAAASKDCPDIEAVLEAADQAMYQEKSKKGA